MEETLKKIFADKTLNYEDFVNAMAAEKVKLADLSKGDYVDKSKYEKLAKKVEEAETKYTELAANAQGDESLKKQIEDLTKQLQGVESEKTSSLAKVRELSRREMIRNAGIDGEFIDLANYKFRDIEDEDDFKEKVSAYAKENAELWVKGAPAPNLTSKPAGEASGVEAVLAKLDPTIYGNK